MGVIGRYVEMREKGLVDREGEGMDYRIPTHLLWCVFEALAGVSCLMAYGALPGLERPNPKPAAECHFDIKPRNIFLSEPGSHGLPSWPGLPVPKLGDWGTAMNAAQEQWENYCRNIGTAGYKPAEKYLENPPYHSSAVGPHSDIWSIGRTMASLMHLDRDEAKFGELNIEPPSKANAVQVNAAASAYYPDAMVALVNKCLSLAITQRPKPENLWHTIQQEVATYRGLSGMPLKQTAVPAGEILLWKRDVYQYFARAES